MKKTLHILFFGSVLSSANVVAQPTLTATGINPVVGDQFVTNVTNFVNQGSAGASQTWNLSAMTPTSSSTYTTVASSSTPNGASFPNSNISFASGSSNSYYKTSSTAFQNYGSVSGTTVMSYSNPEDFLHFPFTYNNSYTDTWATTFTSSYTFYRTGTTTVTADSYGTLTTPAGTFSNVLRIHFVQNYQDSANIPSYGTYLVTYSNDEYMWYLNGTHFPIAFVYTLTSNGNPSQGGSYIGNVNAINEPSALISYKLFPNPSVEEMNVNVNLKENQKLEIKIFNSVGELIKVPVSANAAQGTNEYKINVSDLPEGIYFSEMILNGTSASTRRFTVSK